MSQNFDSPIEIHFCGTKPEPSIPALSKAEGMIAAVWPESFTHHVAGLMAPDFWAVDTPIAVGETREAAIRAAAVKAEHIALERSLAYEHAASLIDSNCTPVNLGDERVVEAIWFDTTEDESNTDYYAAITEAVGYLDARGLIERHPDNRNLVQVREESEASR